MEERKRLDPTTTFQAVATAARVPKSYLSRVLHLKADLNSDQLYAICRFLELTAEEESYLHLLLEHARSGLRNRKTQLLREIKRVQAKHLETSAHIRAPEATLTTEDHVAYYLDPNVQLVHVCLAIQRYQANPTLLARDLNVTAQELSSAVTRLERIGLVRRSGSRLELLVDTIHLPRQSPVFKAWRNQLKVRAMHRLDKSSDERSYSFAVVFTGDDAVRDEIQRRFLALLKEVESLVAGAPQEDAYQMSFDLFPWTAGPTP